MHTDGTMKLHCSVQDNLLDLLGIAKLHSQPQNVLSVASCCVLCDAESIQRLGPAEGAPLGSGLPNLPVFVQQETCSLMEMHQDAGSICM